MDADAARATPTRVPAAGPPPLPGEPAALARLAEAGLTLTPSVWVPPAAEETFYRLNHLPVRLAAIFEGIASHDPDEEDVEDLAPEARSLLTRHVMLDAWVDDFYEALLHLPARVRVRRPGGPGRIAHRGRPALLALRATWADAWSDDAVLDRLRASGSVALAEAPALVHAAEDGPAPDATERRVHEVLGEPVPVFVDGEGRITRVGSAARPEATEAER